jgi:hypothetical protein
MMSLLALSGTADRPEQCRLLERGVHPLRPCSLDGSGPNSGNGIVDGKERWTGSANCGQANRPAYSHLTPSLVDDVVCQLLGLDPFAVLPAIAGLDGLVAVRKHLVLSNQLVLQVGHSAASRAFRLGLVEM